MLSVDCSFLFSLVDPLLVFSISFVAFGSLSNQKKKTIFSFNTELGLSYFEYSSNHPHNVSHT